MHMGREDAGDAGDAPDPLRVDDLDRRLIQKLFAPDRDHVDACRTPVKELARALDVHRNTVGTRLRRLREADVFLPPVLAIDPIVVGQASGVLHLEAPGGAAGEADRGALFALDGVEALLTGLDGWDVPLHGRDPSEVRRRAEVVAGLLDAESTRWVVPPEAYETPEDPVTLTDLDVRVVEAMLGDARRAFRDVADDVGVSPKTVRRRYRNLRKAGALYFGPRGYEAVHGATLVLVEVDTDPHPTKVKGAILEVFDDVLLPNFAADERALLVAWTPDLARLGRQVADLGDVGGVTGARHRVLAETRTNPRIREWVGPLLRSGPWS